MTEPARWPNPDPGWRVRMAGGLLVDVIPKVGSKLSADLVRDNARQDQHEAEQAKLKREQAEQDEIERVWDLQREGKVAFSVRETMAAHWDYEVAVVQPATEKELNHTVVAEPVVVAEPQRPKRIFPWQTKKAAQQLEAQSITEPASKADLAKLERRLERKVEDATTVEWPY